MKKLVLTPALILWCLVLCAQVSQAEKDALVDIYHATQGDQWTESWDLQTPVAQWQGVTVVNDKVTAINLLFNNMTGELPPSIGNLVHLKTLELSFNKLEGTLPATLGNLKNLEVLAFNGNLLTGTIPESIGNLTNLKQLHLSSNNFSGSIPETFEALTALEVFNVFDNQLAGALPVQLSNNENLKELMIAENNFTNTDIFSVVLMSNSGILNLDNFATFQSNSSVITIETSDDEN
jgi:Leucine-rich repeat (LRR) protein